MKPAMVMVPQQRGRDVTEGRSYQMIEDKSLEFRELMELAYSKDPKRAHCDLISMGYWTIAAQLKIDHQAGRLP